MQQSQGVKRPFAEVTGDSAAQPGDIMAGKVAKVSVKWGKETYSDIEVDLDSAPLVFKSQLFALTGVPPDRQKVMIKGALLKDDEWGKAAPKDGATVMLMGSAEAVPVEAPKNAPTFVEDLPEHEQEHLETKLYGSGLENLGNTCYMNSTVQCLFAVEPLRKSLFSYKGAASAGDSSAALTSATRELFRDLERGGAPFAPYVFLMALRARFPQFAETGPQGAPMQQDAEECWRNILTVLREKVKDDDGVPVINKLFGVGTRFSLKAEETGDEWKEEHLADVLKCNIDDKTSHLHEGIALGLKEEREKRNESLGRDVVYRGTTEITSLPPYLTVQMMRFFFRRDNQQKAKILKRVPFTLELDTYEFCSPELKAELEAARVAYKEAQDRAAQAKKLGKAANASGAASSASGAAAAGADVEMQDSGAAAAVPADRPSTSSAAAVPGSKAMTGKYELCGVVTHKGRTADSGHYVAWVKQPDGKWVCFDDDKLTIRTDEEVLQLCGGGDWHMAYLLIYRAITIEVPSASTATADAAAAAPEPMATDAAAAAPTTGSA